MITLWVCWSSRMNSWAAFLKLVSCLSQMLSRYSVSGWFLLGPGSIWVSQSCKYLLSWNIKWKNVMHSLEMPCYANPVLTPLFVCRTGCWESLMFVLLHVLGVCITYGVSHFQRGSSIWAVGFSTFPSTECQRFPPSWISSRCTLQMEIGMLWFGSNSTGGRNYSSFHRSSPSDHLFLICRMKKEQGGISH